ncbi:MAG: alpha/beta hydrolase [Pseudomonadota bacterium]
MNTLIKALAVSTAAGAIAACGNANTDGADAAYTVERVTFESGGETLVGDLYIPAGADNENRTDAIVVTGAWTTIKEHMSGTYAAEMAKRGDIALAFDFRNWGESGGATRSFENPALKIEDIIAAGDYLSTRPEVDAVNGLGICASAGYMATAAEQSSTFKAIALVAPWLHNSAIVEQVYGGADGVASLIETGRKAAAIEADTGEPQLIPASGPEGSAALMPGAPYYTEPGLGLIPEWENTFNLASWEGWLTFDGIRAATDVDQPFILVHSDDAAIPNGAHQFFANLAGEKDALWLEGVTQFDFYHREDVVATASDAVADFFARHPS